MSDNRASLKSKMQATAFAIHELRLYLDTHPTDSDACELYNRYREEMETLEREYLERCGDQRGCCEWVNEPWPWELNA